MFKLISAFRSLWRLFGRGRKDISRDGASANIAMTGTPEGSKRMTAGFDMTVEITKLSRLIVEPVTAKLTMRDLDNVIGRIRSAFEELNAKRTNADADFESMAAS